MGNKTRFWRNIICVAVALAVFGNTLVLAKHTGKNAGSVTEMPLYHLHALLDHGLIMVMQGANLRLLSSMEMAPGIDQTTEAHGTEMIAEGRAMIKEMLSGSIMRKMHEQGRWSDPLMAYTHELGAAMLAVVDDADLMAASGMSFQDRIEICHIRIALNHAVEMGAEGANLRMLGKMNMAPGIDAYSITHGRQMSSEARTLWEEVMGGKAMKTLHAAATTPEASVQLSQIRKMATDSNNLLILLGKMDIVK